MNPTTKYELHRIKSLIFEIVEQEERGLVESIELMVRVQKFCELMIGSLEDELLKDSLLNDTPDKDEEYP